MKTRAAVALEKAKPLQITEVDLDGPKAGEVLVEVKGKTLHVAVHVAGAARPRALHFENDIVPLLSRFGCNSSGCHGNAQGQNGQNAQNGQVQSGQNQNRQRRRRTRNGG